jgi:hypothetical protein
LAGNLPDSIFPYIAAAPVIPLKKKDGGIRPIAIGEIWRRITSKVAVRAVKLKTKKYFAPYQVGVGIPNGCDAIVHAVNRVVEENKHDEDIVLMKVDFKNAFNLIDRKTFIRQVRSICPEILPWVAKIYSQKSIMYVGDSSFACSQDVQQGDPLGSFLFSLALQPLILRIKEKFPDLLFNGWYLDDGTIVGKKNTVVDFANFTIEEGPNYGLVFNKSKCEIWWPKSPVLLPGSFQTRNLFPKGFQCFDDSEISLLGSCVGSGDAVNKVLEKRVEKLEQIFQELKTLDNPQVSLLLLRSCFGLPKISFALRTLHVSMVLKAIDKFDRIIESAITNILGFTPSTTQLDQIRLPCGDGFPGFGISQARMTANCAYLASSIQTLETQSHLLGKQLEIQPLGLKSLQDINSFLEQEQQVQLHTMQDNSKNLQHVLYHKLAIVSLKSLCFNIGSSDRELARITACRMPHSGTFLKVLPNAFLGRSFGKIEFQALCRYHLGEQMYPSAIKCKRGCGALCDVYGDHSVVCAKNGYLIRRHDAIRDVLVQQCHYAGVQVIVEQRDIFDHNSQKPGDISILNYHDNKDLLVDFTVTSSLQNVKQAASVVGWNAAKAEEMKFKKYKESLSTLTTQMMFTPFAFETFGGWTSAGDKIIHHIAEAHAFNRNRPVGDVIQDINTSLSVALAKNMALMLVASM